MSLDGEGKYTASASAYIENAGKKRKVQSLSLMVDAVTGGLFGDTTKPVPVTPGSQSLVGPADRLEIPKTQFVFDVNVAPEGTFTARATAKAADTCGGTQEATVKK